MPVTALTCERAMNKVTIQFGELHGLSPRERDVFSLLTHKIVSLKDIAHALDLSPHTINNHFKNIFEKTRCNSRAELLASFLSFALEKNINCSHWHKRPRVLVVDDEPQLVEIISTFLTQRGVIVHAYTDSASVIQELPNLKLDVIVSDIRMPGFDGVELMSEIRKYHHYSPAILFISGFTDHEEHELLDLGAHALLEKPIDLDKLYRLILAEFIDDSTDRSKHLMDTLHEPVVLGDIQSLEVNQVGYGGVFLPLEKSTHLEVGEMVSFRFTLAESSPKIQTTGEIVWRRPAGIGIRFLEITDKDRRAVHEFVQKRKIRSFIPAGPAGPPA